ncbi:hypothetical protein AB4305_05430 [Nocardia sp. 2YAB30]|uniref:hypothetical protein n=1 Tax=unclassified Nocardia TaxID=2637762 RepID=UPI003F943AC8
MSAKRTAEVLDDGSAEVASVELAIYSIFGPVASATDWWLGANRLETPAMPIEKFVAYLAEIISALVAANSRLDGIAIAMPIFRCTSSFPESDRGAARAGAEVGLPQPHRTPLF